MSTRGVKGKKRKRIGKTEDKAQSARFIAAAQKLGVDESGKDFERALDKLIQKKQKP